jgi:DNA polymerase-1
VQEHADMALLSKKLATIILDVPVDATLDDLKLHEFDHDRLKAFLTEFEFNALGRRLFGDDFRGECHVAGSPGSWLRF